MRIFLMRHGQTNENLEWILNDDPMRVVHLNTAGIKQAEEAAEILKKKTFNAIFTSEFARTKETAEIVNKNHGIPVIIDPRINERKTGFDGKHLSEFRAVIGADKLELKDRFNTKPPNGESWQDEKRRVASFLHDLLKNDYKNVLIVTHGEPMIIITGYFRKLRDEEMWNLEISNCQIMEFVV